MFNQVILDRTVNGRKHLGEGLSQDLLPSFRNARPIQKLLICNYPVEGGHFLGPANIFPLRLQKPPSLNEARNPHPSPPPLPPGKKPTSFVILSLSPCITYSQVIQEDPWHQDIQAALEDPEEKDTGNQYMLPGFNIRPS